MEEPGNSELMPWRLNFVEGYHSQRNEILYHPSKNVRSMGYVVFFGGDIQVCVSISDFLFSNMCKYYYCF